MSHFTHSQGRMMSVLIMIGLVFAQVVGACSPETQSQRAVSDLATRTPRAEPRTAASLPAVTALPEQPPSATPSPELGACTSDPASASARYDVDAVLDWDAHTVRVQEHVTFRNDTGQLLSELVFNIETNQDEGYFLLTRIITSSGKLINRYTLDETKLVIPLHNALKPDCAVAFMLDYTLHIPEIKEGYTKGHLGYWGYSARQVNLGMWLPLIAATDRAGAWITPDPHWLGEHFVLRMADFAVELTVKNAPPNLRVAGPGSASQPDDHTWRFELDNAREVALSLSDRFQTLQMSTEDGVAVELFYFSDPDAVSLDAPRHALFTAADAMALYSDLFGAYPYERVVIVEGDFPDGMEFCGLVFVSEDWFQMWQGVANDWLTVITAHEIAHQWWYALVGSHQAQDPYLDEALAIYSEVLFFEHYYPEYLDWWWNFRVLAYEPTGYVDTPIYAFYSPRGYINAIYLRGARMMHLLRADVGDDPFGAWLRTYTDRMAGQVAYPADFWSALPSDLYALTAATRSSYLQQPDVLSAPDQIP